LEALSVLLLARRHSGNVTRRLVVRKKADCPIRGQSAFYEDHCLTMSILKE
jgi:hypothetical protein